MTEATANNQPFYHQPEALLSLQDVAFAYDGGTVVEGLNFSVFPGDYLCIVGENGSGKSTLVKGLLHLKSPSRGEIAYSSLLSATGIGYLPQQTAAQRDFPASVYEVVLSGRLSRRGLRPFYTREDKEAARRNLKLLDIENLADRCYRELSGGQQQRALLARALCATERILLLDEPVAGLDPLATAGLYEMINRINAGGVTIIMVSHDIHAAAGHASHILHLGGRQLFFGSVWDYTASDLGKMYLGGESHD